ncbi:hypothetical protein N752_25115 [Desulforamulus aquiferis]|nr:hypothetical protein [Desulforamulus aquiferis]RYD02611.1 hypothetical protein N752_25115 [Desulforamulus aquiferis]
MWSKGLEVKLCAERLGLNLSMDTFSNRLDLQKSFYLMQVFGVDLGFRFGWYLRGPYCSELTKTAFELKEEADIISNIQGQLPQYVESRIENYRHWISSTKPEHISPIAWKELLGSLHYLKHIAYLPNGKSKEAVCTELKERKSWYSEDDINLGGMH